jgi:hypothetical protein
MLNFQETVLSIRSGIGMAAALLAVFLFPGLTARADTVLLKNGSWIDGKVTMKTDTFVELKIGKIGKIDIPIEEVHLIETNNRTGDEYSKVYVEPKGKVEGPAAKPKAPAAVEPAAKDEKGPKGPPSAKVEESVESHEAKDETGREGAGAGEDVVSEEIDPELKKRIEDLVEELKRQKPRNRIQAERHLEAIGQPAIPFLLPLVKNENDLTRIAAMKLFHSFGDHKVIETAIGALVDENEYVRDFANKTLKRVTGEDFGFQPNASPRRRETARDKWSDWWSKEKKALAEDRKISERRS